MANQNIQLTAQESISARNVKPQKNFAVIYKINLKLTLKTAGVISVMIIHVIIASILLILETNLGLANNSNLQVYRGLFYIFSSTTTIILVMVQAIYLFKKQISDGIHSIELRAGFKSLRSFVIRFLVMITVNLVANGFVLVVVIFLHILKTTSTELMLAFGYSQVFFLIYLSIFMTFIAAFLFVLAKSMIAVMLTTVFMFVVSLSPFFSSIKYLFIVGEEATNYGIKLKALEDYTNSVAGINNDAVKSLYEDTLVVNKSQLVTNFQNNFKSFELPTYLQGKMALPLVSFSDLGRIRLYDLNFSNINLNKVSKTFNFGQWNYDYSNITSSENNINLEGSLFENTPMQTMLENIYNKTVEIYANGSGTSNANKIPNLFMYDATNSGNNSETFIRMNMDNYIETLAKNLPEYSVYFNTLNMLYNRYEKLWNVNENKNQIFSSLSKLPWYGSYNTAYNSSDFYTWNISLSEKNPNAQVQICNSDENYETDYTCATDQSIVDKNTAIAEIYQKVPELSILNYLTINFWLNSFNLNVNIDSSAESPLEDVYKYFTESNISKDLTLDILRHFGVMSSGLFANPMYNDIYTSTGGIIIYQGRIVYVSNIFDFESDFVNKQEAYQLQKMFLLDKTINYKKSFILPLAYVVYFLLVSPLAYFSYLIYDRKSKI